jgi:hypothetical protein
LTVTDWEAVPPALVAEQVKVVPEVSDVTAEAPHPVVDVTADCGSLTAHETETLLVYHPLFPRVPTMLGVITGGVVSGAAVTRSVNDSLLVVPVPPVLVVDTTVSPGVAESAAVTVTF